METHEYQPFFDGLLPRLETARTLQRELDSQLAQRFNVFDYLRTDELGLSRVIADLLNPQGKHGQGSMFLDLLLCGLKHPLATSERLHDASVDVERTIKNDRRLDVYVRIGDHCLAIENKPYAGDQPNQVRDYLRWLKGEFKNSLLVYLSPQGEPPSPESVELADLKSFASEVGSNHSFKIMSYHGVQGDDDFGDYRLNFTLAEWLADCQKSCNVDRLRWFLRDAEVFCRRTVGGHTVASAESNVLREFVLADDKRWDVALAVSNTMSQVKEDVCNHFMELVWSAWKKNHECHEEIAHKQSYSQRRTSYLYIYKTSWQAAQIRLEAYSHRNDNWCIGVLSTNKRLSDSEQLDAALRDIVGESEKKNQYWPWWQWVDEKYRNWDALIPALKQECDKGGGEITSYFVKKFADIAKEAIPIIDQYDGT